MNIQYDYIDTQSSLSEVIKLLKTIDSVSIDTEADSLYHYFEKICLIQLTINSHNYIIDPLSGMEMGDFFDELSGKILILHGGDYDLRMLNSSFGFKAKTVFDTMVAAKLLGYEKCSLSDLVQRFFDVTISKHGQKSNWSQRPLTKSQLEYASEDTRYLKDISDKLAEELGRLNRLHWHRQSCERVVESALKKNEQDYDNQWRTKGSGLLDRQRLFFVRQLWYWRDRLARSADMPPFKIISNQLIFNLADWVVHNEGYSFERQLKLPRNLRGPRLQSLKKEIQECRKTPMSEWPEKKKRHKPDSIGSLKPAIEKLRLENSRLADDIGIESCVLASKASIVLIVKNRPKNIDEIIECSGLMQWQAEILEKSIFAILEEFQ